MHLICQAMSTDNNNQSNYIISLLGLTGIPYVTPCPLTRGILVVTKHRVVVIATRMREVYIRGLTQTVAVGVQMMSGLAIISSVKE